MSHTIPQSASSLADFKLCPMLFYLRHVKGLAPAEEPAVLRQGINWHKCLELLTLVPGEKCSYCEGLSALETCLVCQGLGVIPDNLNEVLIRYTDDAYANPPASISLTDWELEKTIILYSALGWAWYWQNDPIRTVAREVKFTRVIDNRVRRIGKIDRIVEAKTRLLLGEYKSTGKPIDPDSIFWRKLYLDSQITLYLIEARYAQLAGKLEPYGIKATDPLISGVLYDAWHKPLISPKKLTQTESKKFVEDGEYFGEEFATGFLTGGIQVNGISTEIVRGKPPKPTKKIPLPEPPFAIRETPEMFGARLLAEIQQNPEKYFARKEISRTDEELEKFDREYYKIARLINIMKQRDFWYHNEFQCDNNYRCKFHPICLYGLDVSDDKIPEGFKNRFKHKE